MLKLWGRITSVNVQKVAWALNELALPFERVEAGGSFGVVDTPEYRRMNPNGLVPVLEEEDGFVLWESNAIVRYLAAAQGEGSLWPSDRRRRADADRWMEWQSTSFTPAMRDAFWQLIRTAPVERNDAVLSRSVAASERMAAILDAHLADRAFLIGDAFSAADIAVGCAAHRWLNLPTGRQSRPHLERWLARLHERPATRGILVTPIA